jgi:hypothetical protein
MNKTSEVLQGPDESPSQFYERLCEACCMYIPFDLEVPKKQWMINTVIVGQAQGDIRRKLQKQEGFTGLNANQLLEVTIKVFVN